MVFREQLDANGHLEDSPTVDVYAEAWHHALNIAAAPTALELSSTARFGAPPTATAPIEGHPQHPANHVTTARARPNP